MNPRSERRLCPRDSSVLVAEERKALFRHAQVDVCPRCQGVFLDKGEIMALIGHPNLGRFLLRAADPEAPTETQGCPNCGGILEDRIVAGMDIDVCEACRGVWLDAGELERLRRIPDSSFKALTREEVLQAMRARRVSQETQDHAIQMAFGVFAGRTIHGA